METIFVNTENSKINKPHRFRLSLADRINIKDRDKNMTLVNLSIYYTRKNIKSAYYNNKSKIYAPIWNDDLDLPYESYSFEQIQDNFA